MDFLTNYSKVPEFTECNVAILVTGIVIGVITSLLFFGNNRVNNKIDMDSEKVVNAIPIPEGMAKGDKLVLCRCWKSKNFPYCDGSHTKHNKETGDNVGPLIIKKE